MMHEERFTVGPQEVTTTYRDDPDTYFPQRCVTTLEDRGLLPMGPKNPKFPLFIKFLSAAFWHGSRAKDKRNNSSTNTLHTKPGFSHQTVRRMLEGLGIEYKEEEGGRGLTYDGYTGHLVEAFGYPKGRKLHNQFLVPPWANEALRQYNEVPMPAENRTRLFIILRDFIETMLFFKTIYDRSNMVVLNTQATPELATEHAKLVEAMTQTTFPGYRARLGRPIQSSRNAHYHVRLYLAKTIPEKEQMMRQYREGIERLIANIKPVELAQIS